MATYIKNTSSMDTHRWGGKVYNPLESYELEEVDRIRLLSDVHFLESIEDATALVIVDSVELNPEQGLWHVRKQLREVHEAVAFSPAVGINAPALVTLTPTGAAHGHQFEIGDEMFALTHLDGLVLNDVKLQLHMVLDNSIADRWIQFDFTLLSTTGILDRAIDGYDTIVSTGPVEVPTTPYLIFETKISIPLSLFEDERDNLFIRIKRTVPAGKTAPTNDPVIVRLDKIHKQKLDI